ncbi:MAG: HlyC/CorC family transporter [Aeromicrobium sp.]|nr:MAG: HlyC/CorC family transporter [Aeromicrobium sp.]
MWQGVAIAVVLIALAGLLVAIDAAISAFSKARAEELAEEGSPGAERLARILDDPAPYLNTILLLRVLSETSAIVIVAAMVADEVTAFWTNVLIAGSIMTVVSFVVVGVGPRTLGRQQAEGIAVVMASPVMWLTTLLGPFPKILIALGNALTPGKGFKEGPFASEVEVRELVDLAAASAVIESEESKMIQSVFDLDDTIAREVMVPRTDLVFIESTKTLRQTMSLALRSGYSRIPVVGENLDDILGMAYLKDVTKRVFDNHAAESSEKVESICRPCMFIPDSKHVNELLREMQSERTHVAIVIDEFGGTAGMITIEDILEEIVGEITDEFDAEPDEVEFLANGAWRVSSRYSLGDIEELCGVPIDEEDVDSVGGLMAKLLGYVPIPGASVEHEGLIFEAQAPSGRRNQIGRVLITPRVQSDDASDS